MRHFFISSILSVIVIGFTPAACEKKNNASQQVERPATPAASVASVNPGTMHAVQSVRPGSYADWCGEHQVPESLCTRCNSSLIAAFKATGDWCEEHGLPESQCLICNPDLKIERPRRTGETSP